MSRGQNGIYSIGEKGSPQGAWGNSMLLIVNYSLFPSDSVVCYIAIIMVFSLLLLILILLKIKIIAHNI